MAIPDVRSTSLIIPTESKSAPQCTSTTNQRGSSPAILNAFKFQNTSEAKQLASLDPLVVSDLRDTHKIDVLSNGHGYTLDCSKTMGGPAQELFSMLKKSILPHVTNINLNGCKDTTDATVLALVKNAPKLRSLNLERCAKITKAAIEGLANLQEIDLTSCSLIPASDILALVRRCPELAHLNLVACSNDINTIATEIIESCNRSLLSIALTDIDVSEKFIATLNPAITSIRFFGCTIDSQAFLAMNNFSALKSAAFLNCSVTGFGTSTPLLINGPQMESLSFGEFVIANEQGTSTIINCPQLKSLNIVVSQITDEALKAIVEKHKLLEEIDLTDCTNLTDEAAIAIANNCPQLKSITLPNSIKNVGITTLAAKCSDLKIKTSKDIELPETPEAVQAICPRLSLPEAKTAVKNIRESIIKG